MERSSTNGSQFFSYATATRRILRVEAKASLKALIVSTVVIGECDLDRAVVEQFGGAIACNFVHLVASGPWIWWRVHQGSYSRDPTDRHRRSARPISWQSAGAVMSAPR